MKRLITWAAVSVLVAGVAACTPTGSVPMFPADPDEGSLLARFQGELALRDDCLVIVDREESWAVAWASPATTWNPSTRTIDVRGTVVQLGQPVGLVGGEMHVNEDTVDSYEWVVRPNEGCLRQDGFWFAWDVEQ